MKRRLRSIMKWGGVALCVCLLAVWSVSRWRMIAVTPNPTSSSGDTCVLLVQNGIVTYRPQGGPWFNKAFCLTDLRVYEGDSWEYHWDWWAWGFDVVSHDRRPELSMTFPLWLPILLIALMTWGLFIVEKRRERSLSIAGA